MLQKTYIMLKPDAVRNGHIGEIVNRIERSGLKIERMELAQVTPEQAAANYAEHEGKPFYEPLIRFMTGGPTVALILEGKRAVEVVRRMMGPTFGPDAPPGTLRGDFAVSNRFNLVHGSDSPETAEKEIALFFDEAELVDWWPDDMEQVYDFSEGGEPV